MWSPSTPWPLLLVASVAPGGWNVSCDIVYVVALFGLRSIKHQQTVAWYVETGQSTSCRYIKSRARTSLPLPRLREILFHALWFLL